MKKIQKYLLSHPWQGFSLALFLALLGILRGTQLPVNLDLTGLLPDERQSVIDMHEVTKELGGVGYLITLIGPTDSPQKYLKTIAKELEGHSGVKYTFYHKEKYELQDKFLYIIDDKEFRKLRKHARTLFTKGKSSFNIGLDSNSIKQKRMDKAKEYFAQMKSDSSSPQYFLSKDGKYAMLLIKPDFDSTQLALSQKLVNSIQLKLQSLNIPFLLSGRYVNKVRNAKQFSKDAPLTGAIGLIAIALVLCFGLGTFRGALLTIGGIMIAIGWTLGIAHQLVGQINVITGFLLAILGGLGAEYHIHLIRRFYQHMQEGDGRKKSIELTYTHMGRALFSAAITSASAFLILAVSDFRGFSEMGIIAGGGIISIYCVYMLCFPLFAKYYRETPRFTTTINLFGYFPITKKWAYTLIALVPLLIYGASKYEFEYDFQRMQNLSQETIRIKELTDELFGKSMNPAALRANSPAQAQAVEKLLQSSSFNQTVDQVISLKTLVPINMERRERQLKKLKRLLDKTTPQDFKEKTGMELSQIQNWLSTAPYTKEDLPLQLHNAFGKSGNIVLVYPKEQLDFADTIHRFADTLVKTRDKFPGLVAGNGNIIFSEILHHINHDGLIVLVLFLVGAFFIFWLDFKTVKGALVLEAQLLIGIFALIGLMGILGVRFTIFNITMIPAVLAAGVDMGVHVRHQEKRGKGSLASAKYIAQAVQLSAITTAIGFGALFLAQASMLKGIAWISVLGQLSMYLICMIFFPAIKDLFYRKEVANVFIYQKADQLPHPLPGTDALHVESSKQMEKNPTTSKNT